MLVYNRCRYQVHVIYTDYNHDKSKTAMLIRVNLEVSHLLEEKKERENNLRFT